MISKEEIKDAMLENEEFFENPIDEILTRLTGAQLRSISRRVRERTEDGYIEDKDDRQLEIALQVKVALDQTGVS